MNFDDYQDEARRTASNQGDKVLIFALGLCGEAGEVADLIKKWKGHGHDLDRQKVTKELGDVLWYLANLADQLEINLDVVAHANVAKLRARYPQGFSVAASKAKADETPAPAPTAPGPVFSIPSDLSGLARREQNYIPHVGSPTVSDGPSGHGC